MQLTLLRHGATEWNNANRLQGQTDIALSPRGIAQANALRNAVAEINPQVVVSSTLSRAQATARLAGLEVDYLDDDLREMGLGEWEGSYISSLDADAYAAWRAGEVAAPGGESFEEFHQRVSRALERLRSRCAESGYERALLVAHGGVLRSALYTQVGLSPAYYAPLAPGSLCTLEYSKTTKVVRFGWSPHLDE